ncbi:hypothetical protein TWF679_000374 [Orbilia oligospora]|uniref:Uncharacterized protein n=1 Tax=Orbilia oligospora TaxID=2813651 RepID=A0A8H8VI29_ORBOL|nr:hypothetical protein TWF679_000374 [Orbilia oligospora]
MFKKKAAISIPEPGHLAGQMKWHITRYPRPAGTLIKLGNVLTDPYDPETYINRRSKVIPIDQADLLDQSDIFRTAITATTIKQRSASAGVEAPVWAPLVDLGLMAEVGKTKEYHVSVNTEAVTAEVFLPPDQWLSELLEDPQVVQHIREQFFPTLYVIIGVATASKVRILESSSSNHNTAIGGSATLTPAGIGANVGVSDEEGGNTTVEYSIPNSSNQRVDFAYRVRKFRYSKLRRKLDYGYKDVTDGALMDWGHLSYNIPDDMGSLEDEKTEYIPKYLSLDTMDFDGEDL